jgi:cytochrome c biogenesis protein
LDTAAESAKAPARIDWTTRLINLFSSFKLAIWLFFLIAGLSSIGTVIQQGRDPSEYIREYGERTWWWIKTFQLDDMYHAWWFTSVLALLAVNATTCLYRRFPPMWKSLREDKTGVSATFVKSLKNARVIRLEGDPSSAVSIVKAALSKYRYRVSERTTSQETTLYAHKGMAGRVAAHMGHISVMVVMFGALLSTMFGFRDFGAMQVGETYLIPQGNFSVTVNKFWIDYHPNGMPSGYYSDLTLTEKGRPSVRRTIEVNEPLVYNRIWLYQASYGDAWDRIEKARILIRDKVRGEVVGDLIVPWKSQAEDSKLGVKVTLTDYLSDFGFDSERREAFPRSGETNNPAVRLRVTENGRQVASPWIFYKFPGLINIEDSKYHYELIGFVPHKYTGLQITRDPGTNVVYFGSILLVGSLFTSTFVYHRRIWVKVAGGGGTTQVVFGGNAHKNQYAFEEELTAMADRISRPEGAKASS